MGPLSPSTSCPWFVDGGDSLHIWRVDANLLNKQSWTANKGSSYGLEVGCGATNLPQRERRRERERETEEEVCYRILHRSSDLDEFFGI
jgi:hypothetical protein